MIDDPFKDMESLNDVTSQTPTKPERNKPLKQLKADFFCNQIYKPSSVLSSHQSRPTVTSRFLRPTTGMTSSHFLQPYLVLLQMGFTMPLKLPLTRCALTAPFQLFLGMPR